MSSPLPLKNKTILITRPEGLAEPLIQRINDSGGSALHYPVIRIIDVEESEHLTSIINNLSSFDLAIFISPTAVIKTLDKIKTLPDNIKLAVIGRSTESMLKKYGFHAQIVPADFNTESLLQHPDLQQEKIIDKSIVIFRGIGGRDLLADSLKSRGANVSYAETYQREKNPLSSLTQDEINSIDILSITSNQGLQNLFDLTDDHVKSRLTALPLVVPGVRAHKLASQLGFQIIIQAHNASDEACLSAISQYFTA